LIRLKAPIPLFDKNDRTKSNVLPVCLPWNRNDPGRELDSDNSNELLVLGWGQTTNNPIQRCQNFRRVGAGVFILQQLAVPFVSWRNCKEQFGLSNDSTFVFDEESQFCAGGIKGKDSCNGDSGGPLVTRNSFKDPWFQIGLVSFGPEKCGDGRPGFYTNVVAHLPWIEKNLEP